MFSKFLNMIKTFAAYFCMVLMCVVAIPSLVLLGIIYILFYIISYLESE